MPYKDPAKRKAASRATTKVWRQRHPERAKRSKKSTHLKRLYGISLEEYEALLVAQGGVCAVCGCSNGDRFSLAVDHDHRDGKVRGLLCNSCNAALGFVNDSIPRLLALIEYIKKWNRES